MCTKLVVLAMVFNQDFWQSDTIIRWLRADKNSLGADICTVYVLYKYRIRLDGIDYNLHVMSV